MILTDTHTHLYAEAFDDDRENMVQRALDAGVQRLVVPAIDSQTTTAMHALKAQYPHHVYLMMGLHPCYVKPDTYEAELAHVWTELQKGGYCAVGEIGIDLYWDKSTLAIQQMAFQQQLQWAKQLQLPINIHCRDAFDEVFAVLEAEACSDLRGIFHCFTGNEAQAQHAIRLGMKLGIGGVVTFKNGQIDQYLQRIGLEHLVLETDAPYLAPVPHRGKRNESAYLSLVVQKLAQLFGVTVQEVARITTSNAEALLALG